MENIIKDILLDFWDIIKETLPIFVPVFIYSAYLDYKENLSKSYDRIFITAILIGYLLKKLFEVI